jgi:diguanylate cyclase (GGDEF)-like protein
MSTVKKIRYSNYDFALLDMIEYPVVVVAPNTKVIYSNSSVEALLKGDCRDCYLSQFLLCNDGSPFELTPQLMKRKQPIRCVYQRGRTKKYLDVFIKVSSSGKELFYVVSFVDVTSYVHREKVLLEEATTDPLTEILNRRRFMDLFDKELSRADRNDADIAFLMFDVDHFKKVNDQYGHAAGDLVLQEITRVAKQELRDVDVFGRLGGEEFGVVLPNTNLSKAHVVADRLRKAIKKATVNISGHTIGVTISVGMIATKGKGSRELLMKKADNALYAAKHNGRDTVSAYTLMANNPEEDARVH